MWLAKEHVFIDHTQANRSRSPVIAALREAGLPEQARGGTAMTLEDLGNTGEFLAAV